MDLMAIKAEIEALRRDADVSYNAAINEALDILASHIEPKPEPTEAGLWQCTKNGANHIIDVTEDLSYPAYCKGGQWTKVRGI